MSPPLHRDNITLFQAFEWHTPSTPPTPHQTHAETSHWARLQRILHTLAELGITSIWLPPGCKANNPQGNGYDCYDLWDLGEFDQKWTRSTKWGSFEELQDLMTAARRLNIEIIWDAVLNHKTAGDAREVTWAVEVDPKDRRCEVCPPKKITAWLKYDFPGRSREGMKYSSLKWHAEHFTGTDWDDHGRKNAIFKLIDDPASFPKPLVKQPPDMSPSRLFNRLTIRPDRSPTERPGKGWALDVDNTHGNNDYLMFSNVDYKHPAVREDVLRWGTWMIEHIQVDGFRLDAVQHYSWNFTAEWIKTVRRAREHKKQGANTFIVGEVWTADVTRILRWLDVVGRDVCAFDSPLVHNFSRIGEDIRHGSRNVDLRTIPRASLVLTRPAQAVTLVTNHDTQPGQTSHTPINSALKSLWYAYILLREHGTPCVFWGDVYGTHGPAAEGPSCMVTDEDSRQRSILPDLLLARRLFAYGTQQDYFERPYCVGWTRSGDASHPGCAVVMAIAPPPPSTKLSAPSVSMAQKAMQIGAPGEVWVDVLRHKQPGSRVIIDAQGVGSFRCPRLSVAVYVRENDGYCGRFPVHIDLNVY